MRKFIANQTVGYCYTDDERRTLSANGATLLTRVLEPKFKNLSSHSEAWNFGEVADALSRGTSFLMAPSAYDQFMGVDVETLDTILRKTRNCNVDSETEWKLVSGPDISSENHRSGIPTEGKTDLENDVLHVELSEVQFRKLPLPEPKLWSGYKGGQPSVRISIKKRTGRSG